ncbi:MAG: glycosyltransferase family 4 protein [Deltaproteobacteria bacterium]
MPSRSNKLRVLVLADDCNPDWPSLPVVGYKAARAIADYADVTVATHVRNRPNLERAGFGQAKVEYIDNEYIAKGMYKLNTWLRGGNQVGWTTHIAMNYPSYLAFEWEVWRRFRPALEAGEFDVVHRITPMSPTLPSPIASVCPVPFVIGPLNGGLAWPEEYAPERAREKEWMVKLREAHRHLPFYQSTFDKSAAILAAFKHTAQDLPERVRERVVNFPEVGVDAELFHPHSRARTQSSRLTFLFAGRLVPYKLPSLAVDCFARSAALRGHRLLIVGDGPEREAIERKVNDAKLWGSVQLLGQRSQAEVGDLMRQSDVFVFPSIRELGAGVIAEAMASGLCCAAVDYGGPSELLANGRGVKVPLAAQGAMTRSFTQALEQLAASPEQVRSYGEKARSYALSMLTWDVKAQFTVDLYERAVEGRAMPHAPFEPKLEQRAA